MILTELPNENGIKMAWPGYLWNNAKSGKFKVSYQIRYQL